MTFCHSSIELAEDKETPPGLFVCIFSANSGASNKLFSAYYSACSFQTASLFTIKSSLGSKLRIKIAVCTLKLHPSLADAPCMKVWVLLAACCVACSLLLINSLYHVELISRNQRYLLHACHYVFLFRVPIDAHKSTSSYKIRFFTIQKVFLLKTSFKNCCAYPPLSIPVFLTLYAWKCQSVWLVCFCVHFNVYCVLSLLYLYLRMSKRYHSPFAFRLSCSPRSYFPYLPKHGLPSYHRFLIAMFRT